MKFNKENRKIAKANQARNRVYSKRILKLKYNTNNFDENEAHQNNNYLALHQEIVLRKSNYFLVKNYFIYLSFSFPLFWASLIITLALLIFSFTKKNELNLFITELPKRNYLTLLFQKQHFVIFVSGFIYAILNFIFMLFNTLEYRHAFSFYQKAYWALKKGEKEESLKIEKRPSVFKRINSQDRKSDKFETIKELPSVKFFDHKLFRFFMKLNKTVEFVINYSAIVIFLVYIILFGQIFS